MSQSKLRQVLSIFEAAHEPLSLSRIAHDLDISVPQLEGMIQHWVRKGKIRQTLALSDCGSCSHGEGDCPFVMEMPRQYELVTTDSLTIPISAISPSCNHRR